MAPKAKETLVPSSPAKGRMGDLVAKLGKSFTGFTTAAEATENVRYVDVMNPVADLPSITLEYLIGAKGWLAGRICQERATFSKGKSSLMYLMYAAAQKRTGAACLHIETEGAPSPADWIASFGCDPRELWMKEEKSLEECLDDIDRFVNAFRTGVDGKPPFDPNREVPLMIGVDSLSQLAKEENVEKDVADMGKSVQPGYTAKTMREWFRRRTQRMYEQQACLFLTTHETAKIATGPAAFGGPQKTSVAQEAIAINATYAYDLRVSKWKDNRTGDILGNETTLTCFKNKWSGDKFGGSIREAQIHLDVGHGFDLIHSDAEFLLHHANSPFAAKFGLFAQDKIPVRNSAGIKCPLLSDKTFKSEEEFVRAFYANEDLLMTCREALKLRGFGFSFESDWKNQAVPEPETAEAPAGEAKEVPA